MVPLSTPLTHHQELASVSSWAQLESRAAVNSSNRLGMVGLSPPQFPGTGTVHSRAPWRERNAENQCANIRDPGVQARECAGKLKGYAVGT
jgi:hypothetical protein